MPGVVGTFPGLQNLNRMTFRAPTNPLDKATVVSIYPRPIKEIKPTIQPGVFEIPAGSMDNPALLVVGPSSWWKEMEEGQPLLEIPHSSIVVAQSVVRDYLVGIFGCDMGEKQPGLFFIPGEVSLKELKSKYEAMLVQAYKRQRNWYAELVKAADVLWARTNGNPLTISDDMRLAARELSLNDKAWLKDYHAIAMINCPACGSLKNPNYPVCPNCKAITDTEAATKLGIKFAV